MGSMKRQVRRTFLFLFSCLFFSLTSVSATAIDQAYFLINIDKIGFQKLEKLKTNKGFEWWVEAGDRLLVLSNDVAVKGLGRRFEKLPMTVNVERLYTVRKGHVRNLEGMAADVLVSGGRSAIIQSRFDGVPQLSELHKHVNGLNSAAAHASIFLFMPDTVIVKQGANAPALDKKSEDWNAKVFGNVAGIDGQRWFETVEKLASFNRNTHSDDIANARQWLVEQFEALPNLEVSLEEFRVGSTTTYNVIAKMVGTSRPDDWYIVGGHYDSTSQNTSQAAPGAEDNGTGSAGVLEMARVMSATPQEATVYFICFSGEEQGLIGSAANVENIVTANNQSKVKGVITMDMIGYSAGGNLAVLLETEEHAKPLMDSLRAAAEEFTEMEINTTFNAWGSDHVPYLRRNLQSVLTIDNDWNRYPDYHRTTDLPTNVVTEMGVEILKMNVATLTQLAN